MSYILQCKCGQPRSILDSQQRLPFSISLQSLLQPCSPLWKTSAPLNRLISSSSTFQSSILSIARLRSLWLIPSAPACRGLWTALYILTVLTLLLESVIKTNLLRPVYRSLTKEQLIGFWGRSFFVWVLPIFRLGYSQVFEVEDLPEVDQALQGYSAEKKLGASWHQTKGPRRLLKATLDAYMWPLVSGIGPRLCVTVFTFCQPFLINATVNFMATTTTTPESKNYGQALVGAYALVYLGLTVCS